MFESISQWAHRWLADVPNALYFFLNADKRIYIAYLLGAVTLAALYYAIKTPKHRRSGWWRYLLNRKIFLHPSARLDYQLLFINPLIQGLTRGTIAVALVPIALWVSDTIELHLGPSDWSLSRATITALFTLVLFVADDFTRFFLHRLMHKVPMLWEIHKLHHSAEVLTPLTVYRIHPLESLLYSLRMVGTQGLVLGLFFYGAGLQLSAWEIAGANAITFGFNAFGANLRHSHIRLCYPAWLERWLISPAQHQIHHSNRPEHFDRNFGAFIALWDRIGNSLILSKHARRHGFGLQRGQASPFQNLWQAYTLPMLWSLRAALPYPKIIRHNIIRSRIIRMRAPVNPHPIPPKTK